MHTRTCYRNCCQIYGSLVVGTFAVVLLTRVIYTYKYMCICNAQHSQGHCSHELWQAVCSTISETAADQHQPMILQHHRCHLLGACSNVTIHPHFTRTVPNFDGLSRENYENWDAEMSRIPNPVLILSRFEYNITSHADKVYAYRPTGLIPIPNLSSSYVLFRVQNA